MNIRIINEAGTVYHETGLTPRQLADKLRAEVKSHDEDYIARCRAEDQRAELLAALERLDDAIQFALDDRVDGVIRTAGLITIQSARHEARAAYSSVRAAMVGLS